MPATMELVCGMCQHRFPRNVTVGVTEAHFGCEHDAEPVAFDLVAVCQCETIMSFDYRHDGREHYSCPACRRSWSVRRNVP